MALAIDDRKGNGALWNSINWEKSERIVNRLQTRIVKAVKSCRVLNGAFSMLEPCEVKVSCRVLKGEGGRKASDLPGGLLRRPQDKLTGAVYSASIYVNDINH